MKSLGSSLERLYQRAIPDREWYADCIDGSFGNFARSLGKHFFYPKSRKRLRRPVGCKASRSSCFRFFFLAIKGPTRVGHPRAEVPHRPGCGVRLTAPAGVFLYVVLRGSFQGEFSGNECQFVGIDQHQDQLLETAPLAEISFAHAMFGHGRIPAQDRSVGFGDVLEATCKLTGCLSDPIGIEQRKGLGGDDRCIAPCARDGIFWKIERLHPRNSHGSLLDQIETSDRLVILG